MVQALSSSAQTAQSELPFVEILGVRVHNVDMATTLATVSAFVDAGNPHHVITADASMLVMAQEDAELKSIAAAADLVTPDSAGILWAARKSGRPLTERVSGVEIAERLCAESAARGYRIYFLGAAPGVAKAAADKMRSRYPGSDIVGTRDGYFLEHQTMDVIEDVRASAANILLVAMGIPKQEKWIAAHRDRLGCAVLMGVGGTLDVLSGQVKRAPRVIQAVRLEWLWRVLTNPRKINKVMLLPRFVRLVSSRQ